MDEDFRGLLVSMRDHHQRMLDDLRARAAYGNQDVLSELISLEANAVARFQVSIDKYSQLNAERK